MIVNAEDLAVAVKNNDETDKKEPNDWAIQITELAEKGRRALSNAEMGMRNFCSGWASRHKTISAGAEAAVRYLEEFSKATTYVSAIVDLHQEWLGLVSNQYYVSHFDISDGNINVHFKSQSLKGKDFKLSYRGKNNGKPWGHNIAHGNLIINSGMSSQYLQGVLDVLQAFEKSNHFQDFFQEARRNFAETHFDFQKIQEKSDLDKIHQLLLNPKFLELCQKHSLREIINFYEAYLESKTLRTYHLRRASAQFKNVTEKTCQIYNMPQPPKSFCKAKDTEGMGKKSGIYFGWREAKCFYVGKSVHIESRLKNHHYIMAHDDVSWLEMSESEIHLNELFYIWLLAPECNSESKQADKGVKNS